MTENPAPPPQDNSAAGDCRYTATSAPLLARPSDKPGSMRLGFGLFWGCSVVWCVGWGATILSFHLNASAPTVLFGGGVIWCAALLAVIKKRTR